MTDTATAPTPTKPAQASGHGQRLWAVLLVVDSFFVIIFGGALAAKLYQHWQAPAPDLTAQRRHHPAKVPAKAEAPAPAPAAAPSPAKPEPKAEPAKPAPAAASKEKAPGPPKPSLLHSAPAREAAKPQAASAAPAPAASAAPAAAGKAMPTEFSIKAPGARSVELVGAFIVHGGRKAMVSHPDGTWTLNLYLTPNTYRYWFVVNGKKTLDPQNPKIDRNASVVAVGQ